MKNKHTKKLLVTEKCREENKPEENDRKLLLLGMGNTVFDRKSLRVC